MVKSLIVSSAIIALAVTGTAQAGMLADFETTSGYAAGDVYNNSGTASPKWTSASGVFDVAAGVGKDGTAGIITHTSASMSGTPSVAWIPTDTTMGTAFSTKPQMAFSFDLKLVSVSSNTGSSAEIFRIYVGQSQSNGSAYAVYLSVRANGNLQLMNSSYAALNTWKDILDGNTYHTVSGVIDYNAATFSIAVDQGAAFSSTGFSAPYNSADYAAWGSFKVNRRTTEADNVIALDNVSMDVVVPEPAALGLLGVSGLSLLVRKRR